MPIVLAWSIFLVGVALLTWSGWIVVAAHAGRRVPYWTNARPAPRHSVWMRSLGAGLVVVSGIGLASVFGFWFIALVLAAFVPGTLLIVRHNRRLPGEASV